MKKQNPNNKLVFNKAAVTELNENQLHGVIGGTSTALPSSIVYSVIVLTLDK